MSQRVRSRTAGVMLIALLLLLFTLCCAWNEIGSTV